MQFELIVLDMDGTLYDISDVIGMTFDMQVDFFSKKTGYNKCKVIEMFDENGIKPCVTNETKSATEFFLKNGIDREEWSKYREDHFDVTKIRREKAVSPQLLVSISRKYPIVLLSTNSFDNILRVLNWIGINKEIFNEIICSDNINITPFNKENAIRHISEKYGIGTKNMLSVGDRYQTDIVPMLRQGGLGVVVSGPIGTIQLINDIQNCIFDNNKEYTWFKNKD